MDTDQIVRADLRELRDMNMKGAPYGYTPFCDSNKDMEGFRYCTLCIQLRMFLGSEMWGGLELLRITMSNKGLSHRFWKQGYWKNHLAGRKYHISALYVIDLVKFRQIAAGDRLRGQVNVPKIYELSKFN